MQEKKISMQERAAKDWYRLTTAAMPWKKMSISDSRGKHGCYPLQLFIAKKKILAPGRKGSFKQHAS
jgi:hypothetical protein